MKKLRLISVLLLITTLFMTVGCNKSEFETYWQIEPYTFSDGAMKEYFVILSLDAEKTFEVWVNVGSVEDENATITMGAGYSESSINYKLATVKLTKELLNQANGWIKLNEKMGTNYSMIDIGTKYKMHINEIVVCDDEGNKYELTLYAAGERISRNDSNGNVRLYYSDNSADAEYFSGKHNAFCVIDEQDKFNRAKVAFVEVQSSSSK